MDDAFSVNDDDELAGRADLLLVRMCGVTPPRSLISPMLDSIFRAIQTSPVRYSEGFADISDPGLVAVLESQAKGSPLVAR